MYATLIYYWKSSSPTIYRTICLSGDKILAIFAISTSQIQQIFWALPSFPSNFMQNSRNLHKIQPDCTDKGITKTFLGTEDMHNYTFLCCECTECDCRWQSSRNREMEANKRCTAALWFVSSPPECCFSARLRGQREYLLHLLSECCSSDFWPRLYWLLAAPLINGLQLLLFLQSL